ncbi:hypothetical protein F5Y08DRAFT_283549 [Xylaria arbuscula]|uniref:Uncharacterized protein n=1 Tax=Xylaria arbuscula TaxID=114810 RepID=A0A9W8THS0_9PEZI|nr:hypothetical protein F5Y08DRAFT_283549 [Xylaria arbuscula]KAJ3560210.1 hypothetical protein NPX13_g9380 [Xylaria arbuscula]
MSSQRPPRPVDAIAPVASSASSQKIAVVESEFAADPSDRSDWQRAHHYHLFPAAPRYPVSVYFPSRNNAPAELPIAHRRPVPESASHLPRISCGAASSTRGLRIRGAPGRWTHIKGTACVVMAIALIFIVVLVLALVANREIS